MNAVKNLAELVSLSEERLTEILGSSSHAKSLYLFLNKEATPQEGGSAPGFKKHSKGFKGRSGPSKRYQDAPLPAAKRRK